MYSLLLMLCLEELGAQGHGCKISQLWSVTLPKAGLEARPVGLQKTQAVLTSSEARWDTTLL